MYILSYPSYFLLILNFVHLFFSPLHKHCRSLSSNSIAKANIQKHIDSFRFNVEKHLPADGKGVVFTSAWLVSDNAIVALLHDHFPEILKGMNLVGVDTLHLFPETHQVTKEVEAKYNKQVILHLI